MLDLCTLHTLGKQKRYLRGSWPCCCGPAFEGGGGAPRGQMSPGYQALCRDSHIWFISLPAVNHLIPPKLELRRGNIKDVKVTFSRWFIWNEAKSEFTYAELWPQILSRFTKPCSLLRKMWTWAQSRKSLCLWKAPRTVELTVLPW